MKSCPACLTQYTDDTLRYCLQDGNPLVAASQSDARTVVLGETDTLVNPRTNERAVNTREDVRVSDGPSVERVVVEKRRSRTGLAVAVTATVMLLIFGLLGLGGLIFIKNRQADRKNSVRSENVAEKTSPRLEPSPTPSVNNSPIPRTPPPPLSSQDTSVDADLRDEILSEVNNWKETTEDMDVDSLMSRYAPKVDYYNKKGVGMNYIRGDKSRAFSRFDDVEMKLSNIEVKKSEANDKVIVLFDKEWRFTGERTSTGKVRQLLELSKFSSGWLITAERDLKVY
jgi:hypothetical protein